MLKSSSIQSGLFARRSLAKLYVNFTPQNVVGAGRFTARFKCLSTPAPMGSLVVSDQQQLHFTPTNSAETFIGGDYTLAMSNVPSQVIYGNLRQTSGPPWDCIPP